MICKRIIKKLFKTSFISKCVKRFRKIFQRKKKRSMLVLNDDCLRDIFLYLKKDDLKAICNVGNERFNYIGGSVFLRKFGDTLNVSKENFTTGLEMYRTFGHLIKVLVIEFNRVEIGMVLGFEQHLNDDLEELRIIHLREANPGKSGERELASFIHRLNVTCQNLKRLTVDYRNTEKWCSYIKSVPFLPRLESLTINGLVRFADILDIEEIYYHPQTGYWQWRFTPDGYVLSKPI